MLRRLLNIAFPSTLPSPLPSVPKRIIMTMAIMSSSISTLNTVDVNFCCLRPKSSRAFIMILVDDMAIMPPRYRPSMPPHWNAAPTPIPIRIIPTSISMVAIIGVLPILRSFLKLNSRPSENMMNITPISAQVLIDSASTMVSVKGMYGPARKPATM